MAAAAAASINFTGGGGVVSDHLYLPIYGR